MRNSPWLVFTYTVIILLGILIALPNALPQSILAAPALLAAAQPVFRSVSTFAAARTSFSKSTKRT